MADLPKVLLVPVDGSKNAGTAADYAGKLAAQLGCGVQLLFAFAKTPQDMFGLPSEMPNSKQMQYFAPEAFDKLKDDTAKAAFAAARKAMSDTSADVSEQIVRGEPGDAILEHAATVANPMIVIGRRGLSQFRELLVGSTTQRVMHHAKCPVLVIR